MKPKNLNDAFKDATENNAIETMLKGLCRFPEPERQKWVAMIATTAISVLHGTYGRQFTEGYLHGARLSLDDPALAAPIKVEERSVQ